MSTTYTDLPNTVFPDSVDAFPQFLNMTTTDLLYVKQYQEAMEDGDAATAQIAFNNISNGSQKIISPLRMNQLREAILALEKFYGTDIQSYVTLKQTEWTNTINQFTYQGIYTPSTTYVKNNIVRYTVNGVNNLYLNIYSGATPSGTAPDNTTYWQNITVQGIQGDTAPLATFMFAWDAATSYQLNNIVVYNNAWWIATQANQNQEPSQGSAYWNNVLNVTQAIYPIQSAQPSSQSQGELWFKVLT